MSVWGGYLRLMADDGLRVARTDQLWGRVETAPPRADGTGSYDWSSADEVAGELARAGVRWEVVLTGSPRWASAAPGNPYASPVTERFVDFAAYAAAFAARYGPGGTFWAAHPALPARPVRTFEIWNEPNTAVHWGLAPDPAAYAALYTRARAAIRAVDATADVLVGGIVWNDDAAYLGGVLRALGPGAAIDGVASHPYAPTGFAILPNVVRVRGVLDRAGLRHVPLVLNELGWPAAYDRAPSPFALQGPVTDRSRAATTALTVDALARSTCEIGGLSIYDLVEAEDNPRFVESLMGIYRRDGSRTATSAALAGAVARYRKLAGSRRGLGPLVPVCGMRGSRSTQLLGLSLRAVVRPDGCAVASVAYRGLPLEEAQVRVLAPYVGVKPTAADGTTVLCPPRPGGGRGLRLRAEVPGAAASNWVRCATRSCVVVGAGASCVAARARATRARGGHVVVRLRGCSPIEGGAVRVRLSAWGGVRRTVAVAPGARRTVRLRAPAARTVRVRAIEARTTAVTRTVRVR